jgi:hypothetical protein
MDVDWARRIIGLYGAVTPATVQTAFRRAALRRHPDQGGTEQLFMEAVIARDLLLEFSRIRTPAAIETEAKWQPKVKKALEAAGAVVFKVHGHVMQESGWPDLQIYARGRVWHLELKVGKNGCEPLQKHRIKELIRRGIWAGVFGLRNNGMWIEHYDGKQLVQVAALPRLLETLLGCCTGAYQ